MDNFTQMLSAGMRERGHEVQIWYPHQILSKLAVGDFSKKWLGYMDQYFLFPLTIRLRLNSCIKDTLFVFTDQALGPWIPLVRHKKHIVHCHDFLALQSANGSIPHNRTRWSGKLYQQYIKKGFIQGKNFIAVSKNTSEQLKRIHPEITTRNKVVYNGLNKTFYMLGRDNARINVSAETGVDLSGGYILHVGGNQWYKNRRGVLEIYNAWRHISKQNLPLLLIGESPSAALQQQVLLSPYKRDIYFVSNKGDQFVQRAYSGATVLLFPSLAEGFGWPIAEAMSCGCPVITTNKAPMTEVGAEAAFYIDVRPSDSKEIPFWAYASADILESITHITGEELQLIVSRGVENSKRFNLDDALDQIEQIYLEVE